MQHALDADLVLITEVPAGMGGAHLGVVQDDGSPQPLTE
jgi:hypothetical protein